LKAFQQILVACDGSTPSFHALESALDIAEYSKGRIEVLGVEGPLPRFAATIGEVDEMVNEREQFFAGILADVRARAARRGLEVSTTLLPGHPAEVIIHHARDTKADLIVVGHRGHFLHDFALGSTASRVTRHAHCPVLVVR
jgi:nucleotide-binding universal stress UspA family protein